MGKVTARATLCALIVTAAAGCGESNLALRVAGIVAAVAITPNSGSVQVGTTLQLAAEPRDSAGNVVTGAAVTWASSNDNLATVGSNGLVSGVAAGTVTITATASGVTGQATVTVITTPVLPGGTGNADPTLLPAANRQAPAAGTYGRTLSSGQTYIDPNTSVTVLKMTDASMPAANSRAYHDYSEGGPYISQPWQSGGVTFYTLMAAAGNTRYLVDVRFDNLAISNWRPIDVDGDVSFAFSMNPSTPRIAFAEMNSASGVIQRYNTATNSIENTGSWPWNPAAGSINWLQTQLNDTWLVASGGNTRAVAFRPSDGLKRSWGPIAGYDEPHIDRELPVIYVAVNGRHRMGNLLTGAALADGAVDPAWVNKGNAVETAAHSAPLRGFIVAATHWENDGFYRYDPIANRTTTFISTRGFIGFPGEYHQAAQWVFGNGTGTAQWFVADPSRGDDSGAAVRSGMIGMVKADGSDVRLVAAHNSSAGTYESQPHATLAPDGKLVMWTSDYKQGGRTDVFVARMPVR